MRELSRHVAETYLEQRQHLEFPWLKEADKTVVRGAAVDKAVSGRAAQRPVVLAASDLLFEIGTEELPASDLQSALDQLKERVTPLLDELRLAHGAVRVLGTPRRLVVVIKELAAAQPDRTSLVKGQPASRAFDAMGLPTKAAEGFAKSRGIEVKALQVREIDGGSYAVAEIQESGRPAVEVLAEALPKLVAALRFDRPMRWNASNVAFSRPIRWLLALLGGQVVPFEYAGLSSGRKTRGLRCMAPAEMEVSHLQDYFSFLAGQGILVDPAERRQIISEQVTHLMAEAGGTPKIDDALLDEVYQLVEAPTALRGQFDEAYLLLPPEVLISVMKKHQRYFPVQALSGRLLPNFIAVRNGDRQHLDTVADGNEQVIRARYADAAFFIDQDLKHANLDDFLPRLGTLMFQTKLGSMLDKSQRITRLVEPLLPLLSAEEDEAVITRRAAVLCKADLVSHMVIEMTSLQGSM